MNNLVVRSAVILLAALSPILCYWLIGPKISYSAYWDSPMQPLFIFTNASTSYFLLSVKRWWIPAILLMLLTAFSVTQFFFVHNAFAILFFIFSAIPLFQSLKFRLYLILYLFSLIVFLFLGIFWGEAWGIIVLCGYHLHRMIAYNSIEEKRKNLKFL